MFKNYLLPFTTTTTTTLELSQLLSSLSYAQLSSMLFNLPPSLQSGKMHAIRLHPAAKDAKPYSTTNPAPSSALRLGQIPIPKLSRQGEILVRVKATTAVRDELIWPETYAVELKIPGHDFSGIVADVFNERDSNTAATTTGQFNRGDEIFGMVDPSRGSTWAEYAIVHEDEAALKPKILTWAEAACLPLSGLTAFQSLFEHAGLPFPPAPSISKTNRKRVLITGSCGGVGIYLVQLAAVAGLYVVAASSSTARNAEFLNELGVDEVVKYSDLEKDVEDSFDLIVDTVGGEILRKCWSWISRNGTLISVDSGSFDFVNEHRESGVSKGKEDVRALFFIVRHDAEALAKLSTLVESGRLKAVVLREFELSQAQEAYELASSRSCGYGKVVIRI